MKLCLVDNLPLAGYMYITAWKPHSNMWNEGLLTINFQSLETNKKNHRDVNFDWNENPREMNESHSDLGRFQFWTTKCFRPRSVSRSIIVFSILIIIFLSSQRSCWLHTIWSTTNCKKSRHGPVQPQLFDQKWLNKTEMDDFWDWNMEKLTHELSFCPFLSSKVSDSSRQYVTF